MDDPTHGSLAIELEKGALNLIREAQTHAHEAAPDMTAQAKANLMLAEARLRTGLSTSLRIAELTRAVVTLTSVVENLDQAVRS